MQYPVSTLSGSYPLLEQRWIRWHGVTPSLDITFPVHLCAGGCNHECTFARAGAMSNHDALAREHLFNILAHGRTPAPTQGRLLALPRPPAFSYTPSSHALATGAATCDCHSTVPRPILLSLRTYTKRRPRAIATPAAPSPRGTGRLRIGMRRTAPRCCGAWAPNDCAQADSSTTLEAFPPASARSWKPRPSHTHWGDPRHARGDMRPPVRAYYLAYRCILLHIP